MTANTSRCVCEFTGGAELGSSCEMLPAETASEAAIDERTRTPWTRRRSLFLVVPAPSNASVSHSALIGDCGNLDSKWFAVFRYSKIV